MFWATFLRNQTGMFKLPDARKFSNRLFFYHLPALAYAALIAFLSRMPYLGGPKLGNWGLDKLIHCVEYGVLTWLVLRSLSAIQSGLDRTRILLIALALIAAYAGLDEYLQSFVPGRDSTPADFAADLIGGVIVGLIWRARFAHEIAR